MKSTSEKLDCNSCMDETDGFNSQDDITNNPEIHHNNKCQSTLLELKEEVVNNVIVINDSDDDFFDGKTYLSKQNPTICTAPVTFQDTLYLTLEEAFFLSFALFCLTVTQMFTRKVLSLNELWKLCNSADSNFVEKYVTYHYFRIKGWIVKSGLNFGCDFGKNFNWNIILILQSCNSLNENSKSSAQNFIINNNINDCRYSKYLTRQE